MRDEVFRQFGAPIFQFSPNNSSVKMLNNVVAFLEDEGYEVKSFKLYLLWADVHYFLDYFDLVSIVNQTR